MFNTNFSTGQDSFDNILKKIQETIEKPPTEVAEQRERKRSKSSPVPELKPVETAPVAESPVVQAAQAPVQAAPVPVQAAPAPVQEAAPLAPASVPVPVTPVQETTPVEQAAAPTPVVLPAQASAPAAPESPKVDSPAPSKKKEGK